MIKSPLTLGFLAILFTFAVLDLLAPTRRFSDYENRLLALRPAPSFEGVLEGTYMKDFETYINDQFVFRDHWIFIKSVTERVLLKNENNGIYRGRNDYLFDKVLTAPATTDRNLQFFSEFLSLYQDQPITSVIVPSSFAILTDLRPRGVVFLDQLSLIDEWSQTFGLLNIAPVLKAHQNEDIFYKSDHHWTLFGAYLAYQEILTAWNLEALPFETFDTETQEGFYGSYFRRGRPVFYPSETMVFYDPAIVRYEYFGQRHDSLIDRSALLTMDPYRAFMHGNIGLSHVFMTEDTEVENKILIIKDSYANSLIPFLTHHFDQIDVVDLRHFNGSLKALIETGEYDQILFLQNFMQFTEDATLARLRY